MAKKTVTTTVEEDVTPEVNPSEEHDKKVLEALETKDGALEIKSENLTEDKKEEPKEETKVEEKPPEISIDKEALKAEVTKEVKDSIVSQLQGTKEEKKDAYADFEKDIWDKEKRTPTYKEALDFVKTQAKEELKAELNAEIEEDNKKAEEDKKAQETQQDQDQQQLNDRLNKQWDEQIDDLVRTGKLPAIRDSNDTRVQIIKDAEGKEIERIPVEPGKRARYELFKAMYIASDERIKNGVEPITNIKEIFYEHYHTNKQPAGANAPIAGVRKSVAQDSGNSFRYTDVHNKSLEDLLREG